MPDIQIMKAVEYDKLPVKFKKARPFADLLSNGYFLQKKYDGCFGKAIIQGGGESRMVSRDGLLIRSCDHILQELEERATLEYGSYDPFVVLGEVWHESQPFPWISGKFRQHKPEPALRFVANDLLPMEMNTREPYRSRLFTLQEFLGYTAIQPGSSLGVAEFCEGGVHPMDAALRLKALGGYDGAVLRNHSAGYTVGLVKNGEIIKVKPTLSLDLRCTNEFLRYGEKTGRRVIVLEVEYRGVKTEVGSGVPHSFMLGDCLGNIVEIEAMGLTADGRLREPRFKGMRLDKDQPDV